MNPEGNYTLAKFFWSSIIDYTLPVIYNPYGEIIPAKPVAIGNPKEINSTPDSVWNMWLGGPEWYTKAYWKYDVSWKNHVIPEPDDLSFPTGSEYKEESFSMRVHVYGYEYYWGEGALPGTS